MPSRRTVRNVLVTFQPLEESSDLLFPTESAGVCQCLIHLWNFLNSMLNAPWCETLISGLAVCLVLDAQARTWACFLPQHSCLLQPKWCIWCWSPLPSASLPEPAKGNLHCVAGSLLCPRLLSQRQIYLYQELFLLLRWPFGFTIQSSGVTYYIIDSSHWNYPCIPRINLLDHSRSYFWCAVAFDLLLVRVFHLYSSEILGRIIINNSKVSKGTKHLESGFKVSIVVPKTAMGKHEKEFPD